MKRKRMLASVLALLLVVSLLPMTALAKDNGADEVKITEPIGTNHGGMVTVTATGSVETNNGGILNNEGTVTTNNGSVGLKQNGQIVEGTGNNGTIGTNNGTVISNNGTGKVEINGADGKIEINNGLVGVKDDNGDPAVKAGTGNSGTVNTNNGTITTNDGTVNTNGETGKILVNNGTVGIKDEDGSVVDDSGNSGTIETNEGEIFANNKTGTIGTNDGLVGSSCGKITTNNGTVSENLTDGTVGTNNGTVNENYGKVEINAINGIVHNKPADDQGGNTITGKVNTNYGTVYEYDEETENYVTTYGVQVQNTDGGAGTKLLQAVENDIVKLAEEFKRAGYKLVGYENITEDFDEIADGPVAAAYALNNDPAASELSATEFQAMRPSILRLLWEKITGKPAAPSNEPESKTTGNTSIPTSLSADQVKVGAHVRRGNMIFRIIEVTDNDIRVATVGKLSEQDLADMLGCLKKYLSDAQMGKLIGEPELLEQELVTYFFGGRGEHIAFRAEKDLFA